MREVLGSADCADAANSSCEEVVDAECESFAEDEELPIAKECHTSPMWLTRTRMITVHLIMCAKHLFNPTLEYSLYVHEGIFPCGYNHCWCTQCVCFSSQHVYDIKIALCRTIGPKCTSGAVKREKRSLLDAHC